MTELYEPYEHLPFQLIYNLEEKMLCIADKEYAGIIFIQKKMQSKLEKLNPRAEDFKFMVDAMLSKERFSNLGNRKILETQFKLTLNDLQMQYDAYKRENPEENDAPAAEILIDRGTQGGEPKSLQLVNGVPISVLGSDWEKIVNIKILSIQLYNPLYPEIDGQTSLIDIKFEAHGSIHEYKKISIKKFLDKLNNVHYLKISAGTSIQELSELIMALAVDSGHHKVSAGHPGIFYKNGKFYIEDIAEVNPVELQNAIQTLVDLENDIQDELKQTFRDLVLWNIGAAYNFARKYKGGFVGFYPSIMAYGLGQTSKSTLQSLAGCVWRPYKDIQMNLISGRGGFDSESRIRNAISKYTFPIVIEELPNNGTLAMEMLKNSSNTPTSFIMAGDGITQIEFLNLSLAYISTNNTPVINDSGAARRIILLNFDNITKPIEDSTAKTFTLKWLNSNKLDILSCIGAATIEYVQKHPECISNPWEEIGTELIKEVCGLNWSYSEEFSTKISREDTKAHNDDEVIGFIYKNVSKWALDKIYGLDDELESASMEQLDELFQNVLPKNTNWCKLVADREHYAINTSLIRQYMQNQDRESNISEADIRTSLELEQKSVKVIGGAKSRSRKQIISIEKFAELLGLSYNKEEY